MPKQKRYLGVVGDPIAHSLSPKIFSYFAEYFGKEVVYLPYHVRTEDFSGWFDHYVRSGKLCGVNVTLPHKLTAAQMADQRSMAVRFLQAANVLAYREGKVIAENTDVFGVRQTLLNHTPCWENQQAVVFGAGGSAVAAASALADLGFSKVFVVNRTLNKAQQLVTRMRIRGGRTEFIACEWDAYAACSKRIDLLLNATSIGMHAEDGWPAGAFTVDQNTLAFDLVYARHTTGFAKWARKMGCTYIDGLVMLAWQALASWEIWMGEVLAPREVVAAVLKVLQPMMRSNLLSEHVQKR